MPEASEAAPKPGQKKSKNLCTAVWAPSVTPSSRNALSHCLRLWLFSALRKIRRRPEELPTCRIAHTYDREAVNIFDSSHEIYRYLGLPHLEKKAVRAALKRASKDFEKSCAEQIDVLRHSVCHSLRQHLLCSKRSDFRSRNV